MGKLKIVIIIISLQLLIIGAIKLLEYSKICSEKFSFENDYNCQRATTGRNLGNVRVISKIRNLNINNQNIFIEVESMPFFKISNLIKNPYKLRVKVDNAKISLCKLSGIDLSEGSTCNFVGVEEFSNKITPNQIVALDFNADIYNKISDQYDYCPAENIDLYNSIKYYKPFALLRVLLSTECPPVVSQTYYR